MKISNRHRRTCSLAVFCALASIFLILYGCGDDDDGGPVAVKYSISGQVISPATFSGLSGVTMTLSGGGSATTITDAGGNYTFSGLDNGSYTITLSATGHTFDRTSSTQTVIGANITGVNFTVTSTQGPQVVTCPLSGATNVTIQDFSFTPQNVTIIANGIVKWTNNGPSIHTVARTGWADLFISGNLETGATFCVQFFATGTYPYLCSLHPMTGSVTVTGGGDWGY